MSTWGTKYVQSVYKTGSQGEATKSGWEPFFIKMGTTFGSLSKVAVVKLVNIGSVLTLEYVC